MSRFSKKDYEYGRQKEIQFLPYIERYFSDKIVMAENKLSRFDFIGEKGQKYELKSNKYPFRRYVPLIDKQKIDSNKEHNTIFVLAFINPDKTEELYYIKYDPVLFESFVVEDIYLDRGYSNTIVRIPHKHLTKIPLN